MIGMEHVFEGRSVLIISPDDTFRDAPKKILKDLSLKITVTESRDAADALERTRHKSFDMIVMTEKLDKMRGSFLMNRILEVKGIEPPRHWILIHDPSDPEKPNPPISNISMLPLQFEQAALEKIMKEELAKASVAATPAPKIFKLDVNFINPFIESTLETLEKTCNTKVRKDKVFIRSGDIASGDISALVGMIADVFRGSMGIAFEKNCFLYLVNNMLGEKYTEINNENQDAAGEICNQVFGLTKTKLSNMGYKVQPAIPSIITGAGHKIKHMVDRPVIAVRFECEGGYLTVEAAVC